MRQPDLRLVAMAAAALTVLVRPVLADNGEAARPGPASTVLRDGFESGRPAWKQEQTDVAVNLLAHDRSADAAHEGRTSERFRFEAGPGSEFYYSYALPKVPVAPDLDVNLYVRSDHAGIQLFGRVILPADIDPDTGQPSFILVPGSVYESADRWERLSLGDVDAELKRRVRVLRNRTKRPVSLDGAYLDQLVVNLYGGPGETVVYLDELSVSPVPAVDEGAPPPLSAPAPVAGRPVPGAPASTLPPTRTGPGTSLAPPASSAGVKLDGNRLSRDGSDWVFTAIRAPGASLRDLRRHGFDVATVDLDADPAEAREAVRHGFLLMPRLGGKAGSPPRGPDAVLSAVAAYPFREQVVFWNIGEDLGGPPQVEAQNEEKAWVRAVVSGLRNLPGKGSRLATGDVVGLFPDYARPPHNLDLIGVHSYGWGSTQEIQDFARYLTQRRDLTAVRNAGALFWAQIPASVPGEVREAIWGQDTPPAWAEPRVQPEQARLYTYAALQAGYRGLAFQADESLTGPEGRALLIELALLNAEVDLFESIIGQASDPIPQLPAFLPDPPVVIVYVSPGSASSQGSQSGGLSVKSVKQAARDRPESSAHPSITAAALSTRDKKTKLLVLADLAQAAQWQPMQMGINDLRLRIPGVAENAHVYDISLGAVRVIETTKRVPGGKEIGIDEFGPTGMLLITTDTALVRRLEAAVAGVRSMAISMAIEQVKLQLAWVEEVDGHLAEDGHRAKDSAELFRAARELIASAEQALARASATPDDYAVAWSEARRAGRALRMIQFDHFGKALARLTDAATPPTDRDPMPADPDNPEAVKAADYARRRAEQADEKAGIKRKKPRRIVSVVSAPPLVSFGTLPQLHLWADWIRDARFGQNLLPSGSFEQADFEALQQEGWADVGYAFDHIDARVQALAASGAGGKRALRLSVGPAKGVSIDSLTPYLDHPAAAVRSPGVKVYASKLYRISVKVRKPRAQPPGNGGLIVRPSLGGETLQYRTTDPIPDWTEVVLFRRAPADGEMTVTLGLAGFGQADFDDLKIEALESFHGSDPYGMPNMAAAPAPPAIPSRSGRDRGLLPSARAGSGRTSLR